MSSAVVLSHIGLGDIVGFNPAINYLSTKHDEVFIYTKQNNFKNTSELYKHNNNIKIITTHSNNTQSLINEIITSSNQLKDRIDNLVIYKAGVFKINSQPTINVPDNFYRDIGLDNSIYESYFKISENFYEKKELSNLLPDNFIFTVGQSSSKNISQKIKNNIKSNNLIINTSENIYDKNHSFYHIANKFINLPFLEYVPIIKKAKEIHIIDSAFCLLCKFLSNDEQKKILYNESGCKLSEIFFKDWNII